MINNTILKKWEDNLILNDFSKNTIRNYISRINTYLEQFNEVNQDNINKYLMQIKETKSASTFNGILASFKSFTRFLYDEEILPKQIRFPKQRRVDNKLVTYIKLDYLEKEIFSIIDCIMMYKIRNKAMLYFMFFTGLRISEMEQLKRKDIDLDKSEFKVYCPKVKKEIHGLIGILESKRKKQEIINLIKYYFSIEEETKNAFNVTSGGIQAMFTRINKYATKYHLSPHIMRHSFCTYLLENNVNTKYVQHLVGHASIKTTERYLTVDINSIKDVMEKIRESIK